MKTVPQRTYELTHRQRDRVVVGVDEAGRGAWAGPVVVAAVCLPEQFSSDGIFDSKLLSAQTREQAAERIRRSAEVGIGLCTASELDQLGMTAALHTAASRALSAFPTMVQVLLDGSHDYMGGRFACQTIIDGDAAELCIAAASIIAKTHRDRIMVDYAAAFPAYGFDTHKGYGTARHRAALSQHGLCELHRRSFKPLSYMQATINMS